MTYFLLPKIKSACCFIYPNTEPYTLLGPCYEWIQNMADLQRNGGIEKIFELTEPRFRGDMECDFRI